VTTGVVNGISVTRGPFDDHWVGDLADLAEEYSVGHSIIHRIVHQPSTPESDIGETTPVR